MFLHLVHGCACESRDRGWSEHTLLGLKLYKNKEMTSEQHYGTSDGVIILVLTAESLWQGGEGPLHFPIISISFLLL